MTMKQKILGVFLGSSMLVAMVGCLAVISLFHLDRTLVPFSNIEIPQISEANAMGSATVELHRSVEQYVRAKHDRRDNDIVTLRARINSEFDQITQISSQLQDTVEFQSGHSVSGSDDYKDAEKDQKDLRTIDDQVQSLRRDWRELDSPAENQPNADHDQLLRTRMDTTASGLLESTLAFQRGANSGAVSLRACVSG